MRPSLDAIQVMNIPNNQRTPVNTIRATTLNQNHQFQVGYDVYAEPLSNITMSCNIISPDQAPVMHFNDVKTVKVDANGYSKISKYHN